MILPPDGPPEGALAALRLDRRNPMHAHERVLWVMLSGTDDTGALLYSETEPRGHSALMIGQKAGVKHDDVLRHWDKLRDWGYLRECEREHAKAPRRFIVLRVQQKAA